MTHPFDARAERAMVRSPALRAAAVMALLLAPSGMEVAAESYPARPIKIVSPFSPGSPPDATMRLVAQRLAARFGQSVTIENRPGAGTTIATRAAAAAAPDGYTLLQVNAAFAYAPAIYPNAGFDPLGSFAPVATLASWSLFLIVAGDVPANSVQELVAHAKANPGKVNIGFPSGTPPQVLAELFKSATGAPLNSVPYRQVPQLTADLAAGRIQAMFTIAPGVLSLVREGKVKALAYTGAARHPAMPDVPTVAEASLPEVALDPSDWVGIVAPAGTPAADIRTLNRAINEILASDEVRASFAKLGWQAKTGSPDDFAGLIAAEAHKWPALARKANLQPN